MRLTKRLILLLVLAMAPSLPQARAGDAAIGPMRCNGFNLLDKLAATDPAIHDRIVENAATLPNGQALLWKIEREGRAPSHLFGTVHLSDPRVLALGSSAEGALRAARTVVIENADLSPDAAAKAYSAAAETARFKDGQTLDKLLSRRDFDKLRRKIRSTSAALRPYRPWIISLMLAGSDCERRRVESGQPVLDIAIANSGRERGVPVVGLETTEEQLAALAAIPDREQIGILRSNLALADEADNLLETMVQLYLKRRVGALWELQIAFAEKAGVSAQDFSSFERSIIVDRNRKMRDGALPQIETGNAFIAVGALHLPGPTGLVALLRDAGYTVTAVE